MEVNKFLQQAYYDPSTGLMGAQKLYQKLKVQGVTLKQVQDFLKKQEVVQLLKPAVKSKVYFTITSFEPHEHLQIDLMDLSNIATTNSYYKYLLVSIDIFTRKAFGIAMTKKTMDKTTDAFRTILEEINKKDDDDKNDIEQDSNFLPKLIMGDQDSSFLGEEFTDLLDEYDITFDTYIKGDHNALGVIDAWAKRLKLAIAKYIIITDNKITWEKIMKTVIDNYNNTPNTALDGITPN